MCKRTCKWGESKRPGDGGRLPDAERRDSIGEGEVKENNMSVIWRGERDSRRKRRQEGET